MMPHEGGGVRIDIMQHGADSEKLLVCFTRGLAVLVSMTFSARRHSHARMNYALGNGGIVQEGGRGGMLAG